MKRRLLVIGGVVALAVGLAWLAGPLVLGGLAVEAAAAWTGPVQEFIEEQAQTRLPNTYLITMPCEGRIEPIGLAEGTAVDKDQVVARIVPAELANQLAEADAAVREQEAAIKENDDTSVEHSVLKQTLEQVRAVQETVKAAQMQVEAGKAKLDFADLSLKRVRALHRQGKVTSEEELNRAELDFVEARVQYQQYFLILRALEAVRAATQLMPAMVEQYIERKQLRRPVLSQQKAAAEARRAQIRLRQQRAVMRSPVKGVVLHRHVSDERLLAPGSPLLEIGSLDQLEVETDVLSQDVVAVAPGNRVDVYGPAVGRKPLRGTVDRIYPAGFTKLSSLGVEQQRVKVIVSLDTEDTARLRSERRLGVGYRVHVRIYTASKPKALSIPRSALFRGAAGAWQTFAVRGNRARLQAIQVGLMNDDVVEVNDGVAEGDVVVLAPETNLTDGTLVRPILQTRHPGTEP
jgi:HlyD family secretion protein